MSVTYVYRQRKITYGDYRDDIQFLVDSNPGQMSFEEYNHIYKLIESKNGCNLLVFGLGRDSNLWLNANLGGCSVFLEDNQQWIEATKIQMKNLNKQIDIRHITYSDTGYDAERLLSEYESGVNNLKLELPQDVTTTDWDVIICDAPEGYSDDKPCRMKSIYESYNLSNKKPNVDVIFHDVQRRIETLYTNYFFKNYELIKKINDGKTPVLKHYKSKNV